MTEKKPERRHGTVARQHKAAETDRVAREFIEKERLAREKKTERLEQLRLARDAAEAEDAAKAAKAAKAAATRAAAKKPAARTRKRSTS